MRQDLAEQRFQEIYQSHQRHVLAYFLRRTDATSARDGAAEAFLVAWRRIDDVPMGDNTLPWLLRGLAKGARQPAPQSGPPRSIGKEAHHSWGPRGTLT